MNGKCAKRLRKAAFVTCESHAQGRPVSSRMIHVAYKQLKVEYRAKPFHQRRIPGIPVLSHRAALARFRSFYQRHLNQGA